MFEGFSDEARAVVDASHTQAYALGHHATGTAHLLLGLLAHEAAHRRDGDNTGSDADAGAAWPLTGAGVSLEGLRAQYTLRGVDVELRSTRPNDQVLSGGWGGPGLPWTGNAKKALEFALRRALQLGGAAADSDRRQLITPPHLLLGVLDRRGSTGRQLIVQLGVGLARLVSEAERVAAAAPLVALPTAQDGWIETDVARSPSPDTDGMVFSIFGWPSRLPLDGPTVRQVLTEAKERGDFNTERLLAAAEADAADRSSRSDSTEDQ